MLPLRCVGLFNFEIQAGTKHDFVFLPNLNRDSRVVAVGVNFLGEVG